MRVAPETADLTFSGTEGFIACKPFFPFPGLLADFVFGDGLPFLGVKFFGDGLPFLGVKFFGDFLGESFLTAVFLGVVFLDGFELTFSDDF